MTRRKPRAGDKPDTDKTVDDGPEIHVGHKAVYEENEAGEVVRNNMNESATPASENTKEASDG